MSPWQAARPGDPIAAIDTPALVLDLDAFERNVERMAAALRGRGVQLRAHAKSHKCPEIARRQVAAGAVGICCQKVSEAAVFVDAGIHDVLVTNEVVGEAKLRRLAELARAARIGVLVDHAQQVQALADVARGHGVAIDVYVEVDVGGGGGLRNGSLAARRYGSRGCTVTTARHSTGERRSSAPTRSSAPPPPRARRGGRSKPAASRSSA
jgi:D-serine deaminase-like pyridoxal phosphate-dependent protein